MERYNEMDNSEHQLLEAILQGQRDTNAKVDEVYNLAHEIRHEVASLVPRIDRLEKDMTKAENDRSKIWSKVYELGFQGAVIAYILFERRQWEGVAK